MEKLLQVGVLTSTHGVRGEVKVFPMTDDVRRFKKNKKYILETPSGPIDVTVESTKFFKQFVILKLEGFDSIDDIAQYKNCGLYVTRENAVKCEKDEYFIADLIGMEVVEEGGAKIGELSDVIQTGANDVYVVKTPEGKELLFPAIKDCVRSVDMTERRVTVYIMPGLLD